jgi:hypothetical protein
MGTSRTEVDGCMEKGNTNICFYMLINETDRLTAALFLVHNAGISLLIYDSCNREDVEGRRTTHILDILHTDLVQPVLLLLP